ncbi:hypothetical protein Pst134EA_031938 [Puccinia striiformis f. sp. tritici]|uniref:uncharacterized protein n=1 Tax=Puccinia striiformis f. sp. tritici TaxID=168172 RepID=UPI002007E47C|nr:uncharacterized protein Pst134EA_031938 [Puccinia striiformis f. sp. tritici]KAH9444431.1 hypothetical protein Pst134EA_031938 [Puccinia striiformis f. sp. tritici]
MSTPDKLNRITTRLSSLPSIQLPTDHPRPTSQSINQKVVQASIDAQLNQKCSLAISRLSLLDSDQLDRPSPFHLLLTSFSILLYRYTSETDILIATSSPNPDQPDLILLRVSLNSDQSFSSLLKSIVSLQAEAEADHVPFDQLLKAIGRNQTNPAESELFPTLQTPSHSLVHYNSPIYPIPVKIYIGQHGPTQSLKSSPEIPIKHPDKLCVIEHYDGTTPTSNPKSLERTFTYSQIHHASNVLAHHLLLNTVSYLRKPLPSTLPGRIDHSRESWTQLSPEVEAYIKSDLSIKVTIPALALQNTGAIKGGPHIRAETGTDVLDDTQHLASQLPPRSKSDWTRSVPCLSPRGRLEFQKEFKVVTSV